MSDTDYKPGVYRIPVRVEVGPEGATAEMVQSHIRHVIGRWLVEDCPSGEPKDE